MSTVTQPTVHQQRAAALTTIHDLAERHGLPQPKCVTFGDERYDTRSIDLRLDDNRRGSVEGWAKVLGLGEPTPMAVPSSGGASGWTSWQAEASFYTGPLWLGFDYLHVWSKCVIGGPPTQAEIDAAKSSDDGGIRAVAQAYEDDTEYDREPPDNGDPDAPIPPGVVGEPLGDSGPDRHTDPKDA